MSESIQNRIEIARSLARQAGDLTLRYFKTGTAVETKADQTPVTRADKEAEELIRNGLRKAFPNDAVLGEESGRDSGDGTYTWVVDPIDGTQSFIAGVPFYAVLIGLIDGDFDGSEPIAASKSLVGVLHLPALEETLWAARGQGAYLNDSPCRVSQHTELAGCRFGTTDFADFARRLPGLSQTINRESPFTRTWGDAYGYALVASGRIDAMCDPIVNPWDIAPLPVIIEEAGGRYTDCEGRNILGASAMASNGHFHADLVSG